MRTYRIQRKRGDRWFDYPSPHCVSPLETQSIKYARGYADCLHAEHPDWTIRIVWLVSPSRLEIVKEYQGKRIAHDQVETKGLGCMGCFGEGVNPADGSPCRFCSN